MNKTNVFKTIDEYINSQPEGTKQTLQKLKECILKAAPNAIELFNYNIPAFALVKGDKRDQQIMMAGYKNHVGFLPSSNCYGKIRYRTRRL